MPTFDPKRCSDTAVEEFPALHILGAWMRVGEERSNGDAIQRLYESTSYPRRRRVRKSVKSLIDFD